MIQTLTTLALLLEAWVLFGFWAVLAVAMGLGVYHLWPVIRWLL